MINCSKNKSQLMRLEYCIIMAIIQSSDYWTTNVAKLIFSCRLCINNGHYDTRMPGNLAPYEWELLAR